MTVAFSSYRPFVWERSFERTIADEAVQLTGNVVFLVNAVPFSYPFKLAPYRRDVVGSNVTTYFKIDVSPFIRKQLEPFNGRLPLALLRNGQESVMNPFVVTNSYEDNSFGVFEAKEWKVGGDGILVIASEFDDLNANKDEIYLTNTIKGNGIEDIQVIGNGELTRSFQEWEYYANLIDTPTAFNIRSRMPFTKWRIDAEPQDQVPFIYMPIRLKDRAVFTTHLNADITLIRTEPTVGTIQSLSLAPPNYSKPTMQFVGPRDMMWAWAVTSADIGNKYIVTMFQGEAAINLTKIYGFEIVPELKDDLVIRWYNDEGGVDYWLFRNARKTQSTDKQVGTKNLQYNAQEGFFAAGIQQLNESQRQRFTLETTEVIRWEVVNNVPREFAEYVSGINTSPCVFIEDNEPLTEAGNVIKLTPVECIEVTKQDIQVGLRWYVQFKFTFEQSISNPTHVLN
jgi:hypothetical protein